MATILDGRIIRDEIAADLAEKIGALGIRPKLVIVHVGAGSESLAYIRQKKIFGERIGCDVEVKDVPGTVGQTELEKIIADVSASPDNHGVIVQLPLPSGLDPVAAIGRIPQEKDVDGLTPGNLKLLMEAKDGMIPATPKGILALLERYKIPFVGKRVTIVGKSPLVGKPLSLLLLNHGATVNVCHRRTEEIAEETKRADILIVAAGSPGLIKAEHVSPGQAIIDVGINVLGEGEGGKIVGDVDFEAVKDIVGAITPVPGGVGPMTVASLFENLFDACATQADAGLWQ